MTEFKVGDKVKVLKTDWTGKTVEIIATDGGIWPFIARDSDGGTGQFSAKELELVQRAHKFKVGDLVEITGWGNSWNGQVLQIVDLPEAGSIYYKLSDGSGFSDKHLKAAEAPKPKFKVGDWVKVQGRGDMYDGTVGTVRKLHYVSEHMGQLYSIHKDGKAGASLQFFEGQLVATVAPVPVFKKGDIVANKPGAFVYSAHRGKTLIVDAVSEATSVSKYKYKVRVLGEDYLPGHDYIGGELIAGEPLAEWEIELLDYRPPATIAGSKAQEVKLAVSVEVVKAAHPSNGKAVNDPVNKPAHYTQYPVEVIELTRHMTFNRGNAVKYVARAGFKDKATEKQDIEKAIWYLQDDLKELERKEEAK